MQQTNRPYEGIFITIEGGEGSGKTTLSQSLCNELKNRGNSVLKTREPGGVPLSEHIREILLDCNSDFLIGDRAELFLFLAARAQHVEELILPSLRQGKIVLCERFNDSTIAYQGGARHLGMRYVEDICMRAAEGFIEPDLTFFLDLDPELGVERQRKEKKLTDRLENEKLQFHREVRQGYLHLADKFPHRIVILDASSSKEEVLQAALLAIEPLKNTTR